MDDFKAGELVRIGVTSHVAGWDEDRRFAQGKLGLFMGYDELDWAELYARVLIGQSEYVVAPEDLEKVQ